MMLAIALSAAVVTPPGVNAGGRVTIKIATLAPEGSPWMRAFRKMNKEIVAKTGGRVRFKAYAGGAMGDEKDVLRKIRIGQLHGAGFTGMGMGLVFPDTMVVSTPLLVQNYEEVDYVLDHMGDYFRKGIAKAGFVTLGWQEVGFVYLFSKHPIRSIDDLRRSKLWAWTDDPVAPVVLKAARVAPIPLALTDVLTMLQTDRINAVYTSPLGAIALQWFTKVKYMTDSPLSYAIGGLVITRRQFDRIPPDAKPVVKDICARYMRALQIKTRQDNEEAIRVLQRRGIKLVSLTPQAQSELEQICLGAANNLVGKVFSPQSFQMAKKYLRAFRHSRKKQP